VLSAPWACGPPNVMNITEYANLLNLRGVCRDVRESRAGIVLVTQRSLVQIQPPQ
jgi:hypothetical protein